MANNNSNILELYELRKYYKYKFMLDVENNIDFWSEKKYYGRLDTRGIPIYVDKSYLKSVVSQGINSNVKKQSLLNVASDCFKEMLVEFKSADTAFIISKSIYNPLNIKKTTLIFEDEYINYIRGEFLTTFYNTRKNKIDNEISTFDEFLKLFIDAFSLLSKPIITQTAYLLSNMCSPLATGLSLEISNEKHDDDSKKINGYINDQNFQFAYNTAAKYSFMIDKNAPWRFVFNLSSDYALQKLNGYGINNLNDLFNKFYTYPHLTEYGILKDELIKFYNARITKKPQLQKSSYCHDTKGLKLETVNKSTNTDKNDLFWIKLYYFIRCREERIGMSQTQFNNDLNKITMLYNSAGESSTLDWIVNKTKKFLDGGSNPTYIQYKYVSQNRNNSFIPYTFTL